MKKPTLSDVLFLGGGALMSIGVGLFEFAGGLIVGGFFMILCAVGINSDRKRPTE